jgi:hypothetical protein
MDKLKEGLIVRGCVVGHLKDKKASVQIEGCKFLASLTYFDAFS